MHVVVLWTREINGLVLLEVCHDSLSTVGPTDMVLWRMRTLTQKDEPPIVLL